MFEPLKITAYPRCGIIADKYLPLDGILLYAAMRERYGPQLLTTPGTVPDVETAELPLARLNDGPHWYYAASFAEWPEAIVDGSNHWNKRFDQKQSDLVDFRGRRGKVIVEQSTYKAYHMPVYYRHTLEVSWYAVGDGDAIERLLATMTHIGKKTAQGWGRITRWFVEPWPHDWSVWRDGQLMRAIPDGDGVLHGLRPPYWLPGNQTRCRLP